jgi:ABC-type spermidine/putrescine transport system permease subunit II
MSHTAQSRATDDAAVAGLDSTSGTGSNTRPRVKGGRREKRNAVDLALWIFGVLVFVFLFLPIVYIFVFSFNTGRLLQAWDGFGVEPYSSMWANDTMRGTVWVSIRAGVAASALATVLGSLAGVAVARRAGKWSTVFVGFLALVLVTPEIVTAVSLLPWFVALDKDAGFLLFGNGLVRLVIAHTLFATAVVTLVVRARLQGLDERLENAAADLYAPPLRRFTQITLPLMLPAVLAGALLSFTLSLDNTIVSSFVQVSGTTPWPVYILSSLRQSLRPEIASMSIAMLVLTMLAIGLVAYVLRRAGDSSTDIVRTMGGGGA